MSNQPPTDPTDEGVAGRFAPMPPISPAANYGPIDQEPVVEIVIPLVDDLPPKQNRWTILGRLLLALPQIIVYIFLGLGGLVLTIIAWFCALITGRVPDGIGDLITQILRWQFRLNCYLSLLTDKYPPFHGYADDDYPTSVVFPPRTSLNRLSVLFRVVLMVPAYFVGTFLGFGSIALQFFFWIAALILGRLPDPVYRAQAVVTRYSLRSYAYYTMLTSTYPWGFRGDGPAAGVVVSSSSTSSSDDGAGYWSATPSSPVVAEAIPANRSRFDFRLRGWATAWLWIFFVIGAIDVVLRRGH